MKIPDKIQIGAISYDIQIIDSGSNGEINTEKSIIFISSGLNEDQRNVTLLHECLHACCITLDHDKVEMLSQFMYQIFKQLQEGV